jgi:Acetyltransferase (GNAT) domain
VIRAANSVHTASLVSSNSEALELATLAKRFMGNDNPMLDAAFFLASLGSSWAPKIVAIRENGNIVGLVYFKERKVLGCPTGVLFADGSLGTMYLGDPRSRGEAFRLALELLLVHPKIRGIRLKIPPDGPEGEAISQVVASQPLDAAYWRIEEHARLTLPNNYEVFLKSLGSTTRRNFGYYRRRFDAAGYRFEEHLSREELRSAASQLRTKSRRSAKRPALERLLQMLSAASRSWAAGLKDDQGQWISVTAGCYLGSQPVMLLQMNNDQEFERLSLSLVLRAYLIEDFIQKGASELVFWAGAGSILGRYCVYAPALAVSLDKQGHGWRLTRYLISLLAPRMPRDLARDLQFVAGGEAGGRHLRAGLV